MDGAADADRRLWIRRAVLAALISTLVLTAPSTALRRSAGRFAGDALVVTLTAATQGQHFSTGDTHRLALDLRSGDYVNLAIESRGIDIGARLFGPDGGSLAEITYRQPGPLSLSVIATATGPHWLEIVALDHDPATGRYVVKIERRQQTARDAQRVQAERLFLQAETLRARQRLDATAASLQPHKAALDLWRTADDRLGQAVGTARAGEASYELGNLTEALDLFLESVRLGRDAGDADAESDSLNWAARASLDLGKTEEAAELVRRSLDLSRAKQHRRREAEALNVLGELDTFTGRSQEALDVFRNALAMSRELQDRRGQARALLSLGYGQADLSLLVEAEGSYESALSLWRTLDDQRGQALTITGLGQLHGLLGERQRALGDYREAQELFEKLGDRVGLATALGGTAMSYLRLGDPATAATYFVRTVGILGDVKQRSAQTTHLLALGTCLSAMGRHQEALDRFFEALPWLQAGSDRRLEARALEHIGGVYADLGQHGTALRYLMRSRDMARTVGDRRGELYALNGIGGALYREHKYDEAVRYLTRAVQLADTSFDRVGGSLALYGLSRVERDRDHLEESLKLIRASLERVEALRTGVASLDLRASFLASVRDRHELEIDVLMKMHARDSKAGYDLRAFEASERARARAFLDGLAQARGGIRVGVPAALLERERSIRGTLNAKAQRLSQLPNDARHTLELQALNDEIDSLTTSYRDVEAQIRSKSPRYAALTNPQPVTVRDVQTRIVDRDSVLIQYFLGVARSYVWTITTDRTSVYALPGRAEIERCVRPYWDTLSNPAARSNAAADGLAVSRMLLGPVAADLGRPRLLILPDGILQLLPFGALPNPASKPTAVAPLIADHEVVNLPSASTLALVRSEWKQESRWPKPVVVFADPVFESDDPRLARRDSTGGGSSGSAATPAELGSRADLLRDMPGSPGAGVPRLLESQREAIGIKMVAPEADIRLGFDANRIAAAGAGLADYRIVHFATHAVVNDRHPELSGIVLSLVNRDGQPEDGYLRLYDIYNLHLPVDLVVLSACSTALGKDVAGEGLVGLVRGFMYAGTRRVIASLWKVDDEATRTLMTSFYRALFQKKLAPPAALRAAQLELIASGRWSRPFYWAAFVLQGEWM